MYRVNRVYDLGYVLHNVEEFPWSDDLYLPPDQPWEASTPCAVLDTSELEEGEEPELARSLGLAYVLTVQDVRGVVGNVREFVPQPTTAQLLAALKYYVDHDAFIDDESLLRVGAVRRLGWVLEYAEELAWSGVLCLPLDEPWEASTLCAVVDADEVGEEGTPPEPARRLGFACVLSVQAAQDIGRNLQARGIVAPTVGQLLAAFRYYVKHDAFIDDESLRCAGAV